MNHFANINATVLHIRSISCEKKSHIELIARASSLFKCKK